MLTNSASSQLAVFHRYLSATGQYFNNHTFYNNNDLLEKYSGTKNCIYKD